MDLWSIEKDTKGMIPNLEAIQFANYLKVIHFGFLYENFSYFFYLQILT